MQRGIEQPRAKRPDRGLPARGLARSSAATLSDVTRASYGSGVALGATYRGIGGIGGIGRAATPPAGAAWRGA